MELLALLEGWREEEAVRRYGPANASDYGGSLILPHDIVERMVDCIRHGKIHNPNDLARETRWKYASRYAAEILELVSRFIPPQPALPSSHATARPTPVTAHRRGDVSPQPATLKNIGRMVRRCTACREPGHYSAYGAISIDGH